jgi:hypothetical protein
MTMVDKTGRNAFTTELVSHLIWNRLTTLWPSRHDSSVYVPKAMIAQAWHSQRKNTKLFKKVVIWRRTNTKIFQKKSFTINYKFPYIIRGNFPRKASYSQYFRVYDLKKTFMISEVDVFHRKTPLNSLETWRLFFLFKGKGKSQRSSFSGKNLHASLAPNIYFVIIITDPLKSWQMLVLKYGKWRHGSPVLWEFCSLSCSLLLQWHCHILRGILR